MNMSLQNFEHHDNMMISVTCREALMRLYAMAFNNSRSRDYPTSTRGQVVPYSNIELNTIENIVLDLDLQNGQPPDPTFMCKWHSVPSHNLKSIPTRPNTFHHGTEK